MDNQTETEAGQNNPAQTDEEIVVNTNPNLRIAEMKFGFRKLTDEATGVESKRPTIEVKLPVLTAHGIADVLRKGGKELDYLVSVVENSYSDFVKSLLSDDASIDQTNFPYDKITWEAIANQPESERRGRGIAKEVWEGFGKSYLVHMPSLTGKNEKQVAKQAAILMQKLNPLKNHEDKEKLLPKFKDMLAIYVSGAPDAEEYVECVNFLMTKADSFLTADKNANLTENLGFE